LQATAAAFQGQPTKNTGLVSRLEHSIHPGQRWLETRLPWSVQVLINNAGMYGRRGLLHDHAAEDFMQPFITNAVGNAGLVRLLQEAHHHGSRRRPSACTTCRASCLCRP
jgi:hypothetical protein